MGSISKQPNGRWRARYRDPDGREHARHFKVKSEAKLWISEADVSIERGTWTDPRSKMTFRQYAERWRKLQHWRPETAGDKRIMLDAHLYPLFGDRQLGEIKPSDVRAWVKVLSDGRSPGTVRNVVMLGRTIFRSAVVDGHLGRSPFDGVKTPRYEPRVTVPTVEDVHALVDAAPARWRIAVLLAAMAGLRRGEVLGLTVDRVDFLRFQIRVDRQLQGKPGGGVHFGPPKSARSDRTVPVAATLIDELAAHLTRFEPGPHGLLVVDEFERPFTDSRWWTTWSAMQRAAGVAVRFHDLRHRFASTLLSADPPVPLPAVAAALGDTEAVVLRTYAHVLEGDEDRVRDALTRAFADYSRTPIAKLRR